MGSKSRRESLEVALQILYQIELSGLETEAALNAFDTHFAKHAGDEQLVRTWVEQVVASRTTLDAHIKTASEHWRIERMALVDLNILRLSTLLLLEHTEHPSPVVISDAVDMAKRFGSEHSAGFVNGVLDRIAREIGRLPSESK